MMAMHVQAHVKADCVEAFKKATWDNASASMKEPGIARFDVLQQSDDTTRFLLVEVYRTPDAPLSHWKTAHYALWRDAVAPMMAEPRTNIKYGNVFPLDADW